MQITNFARPTSTLPPVRPNAPGAPNAPSAPNAPGRQREGLERAAAPAVEQRRGDAPPERLHDALERRLATVRGPQAAPEAPTPTVEPVLLRTPDLAGEPNVAAYDERAGDERANVRAGDGDRSGGAWKHLLGEVHALFQDARKELASSANAGQQGAFLELGALGKDFRQALREIRARLDTGEIDRDGAREELRSAFQALAGGVEGLLGGAPESDDVPNDLAGPVEAVPPQARWSEPAPAPASANAPSPGANVPAPGANVPANGEAADPPRFANLLERLSALLDRFEGMGADRPPAWGLRREHRFAAAAKEWNGNRAHDAVRRLDVRA